MWPFKRPPLLEADVMRWHVDNACWLPGSLSHTPVFRDTRLVLPAPGFFVTDQLSGHAPAQSIFDQVKTYAGLADWPVELVSDVDVYEHKTGELVQATARKTPLGMFMRDADVVRISYAPKLLKSPVNLIATLAHELAHYLIHSIEDALPCAPE